jgi:hypothetical protein
MAKIKTPATLTDQQIKRTLLKCAIEFWPDEFNENMLKTVLNRKGKRLEHGDTIEEVLFPFGNEGLIGEYDVASWESHDMWKIREWIDKKPWNTETYQVDTLDPEEFIFIRFERQDWKTIQSILKFFNVHFQDDIIWDRIE